MTVAIKSVEIILGYTHITRAITPPAKMPIKLKGELYDTRIALEDAEVIEAKYYLPKGYKIVNDKITKIEAPVLRKRVY